MVPRRVGLILYLCLLGQLNARARVEGISDPYAKRLAVEQKKQPGKEEVRQWLKNKLEERRPPPDPQQIRRELGWDMVKGERDERTRR